MEEMLFRLSPALLTALLLATTTLSAAPVQPPAPPAAELFDLRSVRLLDSPFKVAMETDRDYLLALDADRLLAWFRKEAGLEPKAENYPGWESQGIAGHSLGHYLSALAMMWQATGDDRVRERASYIVDELAACQSANGDGYVGAIPDGKKIFARIASGDIETPSPFNINGGWVPWYTEHKIFAGLLDVHRLCENDKAREVVVHLADWCDGVVGKLGDEQMQKMLSVEHGGMAESLADIYALTGEPRYLALAKKFRHAKIFDPMAAGKDALTGVHGNTQIPKIIGYQRIHELTGEPEWGTAARNFWTFVTRDRSFVNGGHGTGEHFFPPDKFEEHVLKIQGPETCNSYNMLKLAEHLFCETPDAALVEFYERVLYNHILTSERPRDPGALVYFTPMRPGAYRGYSQPFADFWCCVGTGMENHAKYGRMIYAKLGDKLFVNLFIPSEMKGREMLLRQETKFPAEPRTRLTVALLEPNTFTLAIRYPSWVQPGAMKVAVNGTQLDVTAKPNSYFEIEREWRSGDVVTVDLPMNVHAEPLPHSDKYVALLYGPVLLAAPLGREGLTDADFRKQTIDEKKTLPLAQTPALLATASELSSHIKPVADEPLTFRTENLAKPQEVTLAPFYATHDQRYAVYFRLSTPEAYAAEMRAVAEREKGKEALAARAIDHVAPGEQQPEVDHNFRGEKSETGVFNDQHWRDARDGGWFSYEMKVPADKEASVFCTYWGGDAGARKFDIVVDDKPIATQTLESNKPGEFFDAEYPIPLQLTRGKEKVTVKFQAAPQSIAGGLFDMRIVEKR